jgi:hypothetical protein
MSSFTQQLQNIRKCIDDQEENVKIEAAQSRKEEVKRE